MNYQVKKLENSQVEFKITVNPEEYKKQLPGAAKKISERLAIKGFRSGHVPYNVIIKEVGEMAVLEEALNKIVQESFFEAISKENLKTVGMPKISLEKAAPDNPVVYTAVVAALPNVKLPDLKNIKVSRKVKEVGEKQVNEVLDELRKTHAVEIIKNGKAETTDMALIDMDIFIDKVPVEGGQAKNYRVYLNEDHYIPGFNQQLIGLAKDDTKEFSLDFPKTHYQKHLAGKKADFKIKIKDVYEVKLAELDDSLAVKLGKKTLQELKDLIKNNLTEEAKHKAEEQVEIEIFEEIINNSTFGEIPDVLIDSEKQKMFFELKNSLVNLGISIEQYLQDIKKNEKELFEEFKEGAVKRVRAALVSRQIAEEQKIDLSKEELEKEMKFLHNVYHDNKEYIENLGRPEVKNTVANSLQNKKVVAWLKKEILGDASVVHEHAHQHGPDCKH